MLVLLKQSTIDWPAIRLVLDKANKQRSKPSAYARRKARERAQGPGWSREEWYVLKARGCAKCHSNKRIVPDHVIPLCKGGRHHISNIQPLCWWCNRAKGTQTVRYLFYD